MSTALEIRRNGHFEAIAANPDTIYEVCQDYLLISEAPNIAGLCAHIGTTPQQLRKLFAGSNPELQLSASTIQILASTIMRIESSIVERGLLGDYNAHMSKFVLSAFHDRNEKQIQERTSDNRVTITVQTNQPVTLEELREYDRLEAAMADQQRIELTAMGKIAEDDSCQI